MTEQTENAKNSLLTAIKDGVALHSRYDPLMEARRYIESLGVPEESEVFIFIEPALSYTVDVMRERHPLGKFIALRCSPFFRGRGKVDAEWDPASALSLEDFLSKEIPERLVRRCRLIPWPPSLKAYGTLYRDIVARCAAFLKREDANYRTTAWFGRRWFRNALAICRYAPGALLPAPGDSPVIVTGAGPSLEGALPAIRPVRKRCFILAAASSVPILAGGGVSPDLILSTDGGFWAKAHLFRMYGPFALSITGAAPSQVIERGFLLTRDLSLWQKILIEGSGLCGLALPQRGTVTASAIDLAGALSTGPVYLAGMDLGPRDILLHGRPYILDEAARSGADRLLPYHSGSYGKVIAQRGSFEIYAAWFRDNAGNLNAHGRVRLLGRSHPALEEVLPGAQTVEASGGRRPAFTFRERTKSAPDCLEILRENLENPEFGAALKGELTELLGGGGIDGY